ncbi:hypothetical protein HXX76_008591 [Chlamydomonas incerta]|uniref:Kri1-like C-terminal domain-containing protein n=1 Tax=Chlamydomonas incerta TaxID=51695 RepID=A0A835SZD1_CHLIN|nr:hypothetical protein HXX76_008591 [Chlamydomonas incerta]|eukprot:KAG2432858.1 hypothetical protein HXX76_008591 [Chlamydomonas incerta]
MAPQKKKNLLDDEDGNNAPVDFSVRVNKEFAARFEHNERRRELHRLQAKYPEEAEKLARKIAREAAIAAGHQPAPDSDADSSDEEEEDEGEIPAETEAKIFETMLRIRQKDPAIYQKDVKFFEDEEEGGEEGAGAGAQQKVKKEKPMYLKDMIAKQALKYGPELSSDDDEAGGAGGRKAGDSRHPKAYDPEQEAMRKAFLAAATEAENGLDGEDALGGVLRARGRSAGGEDDEDDEEEEEEEAPKPKKQKKEKKEKKEKKVKKLADAYFADENDEDQFLKEYILNKGWVDREDGYVPSYREIVGDEDEEGGGGGGDGLDDDEDERYLRSADAFEAKYNFRYEEPGADRIVTHPRNVEGTVRKEDDRRKRQRDAKKARQEAAEAEAREDVKRMKNLKKQEIESKLDKLRNVAGVAAPAAVSLDDVLEGDFDPEEWDKKMAAAFNDDYYDAEEELEGLAEDLDLLGGDSDEELGIAGAGASSEGADDDVDDAGVGGQEDDEEEDGEEGEGKKKRKPVKFADIRKKIKEVDALSEDPEDEAAGRKKKRADPAELARQRNELQRLLEDYYKLDYEDNVAGIKTRFRYKPVDPSTFGLSVDDILRLDDRSLNQVVGIKRLAPYREEATKLRPNYKALEMVTAEAANAKQKRREYKKRDWEKGRDGRGGSKGGNWWQGKDARESGDGAGAGPGSAASNGSAEPEQKQDKGEGKGAADQQQQQQQERKRKEKEAGPGPGSRDGAAGGDGASKKRQREDGGAGRGQGNGQGHGQSHGHGHGHGHGKPREWTPKQVDPQQARLASYAVPTLKKDNAGAAGPGGYKRKRDQADGGKQQQQQPPKSDGPQMSRAQKKNLKRTQKRAEKKRSTPGEAKAGEA